MHAYAQVHRSIWPGAALRRVGVCLLLALAVVACSDPEEKQVKGIKEQVQRATGQKDYRKVLELSQKGLALSQKVMGEHAPDTLYFAQGISESYRSMRNTRAAISAMRNELGLRTAAGQAEQKLQPRRTLLIQMAEESGDTATAVDQAVAVARGIGMGPVGSPGTELEFAL